MYKHLSVAGAVLAAPVAYNLTVSEPSQRMDAPNSVVRVETDHGLGSGVLIAPHIIITAAHVVKPDRDGHVDIKTEDDKLYGGDVLWQSPDYDIAAIYVEADITGVKPSPLADKNPKIGDAVVIVGNPMGRYFLTSWGRISGKDEPIADWKSIMSVDVTIAPGNSGGPAFNEKGEVVGLMVNGMLVPLGFGASLVGFSGMVPVSAIHRLLGDA